MSKKLSYWFFGLLLMFMVILTTHYFQAGMMGLTVFILAYLTKGMRRTKMKSHIASNELKKS